MGNRLFLASCWLFIVCCSLSANGQSRKDIALIEKLVHDAEYDSAISFLHHLESVDSINKPGLYLLAGHSYSKKFQFDSAAYFYEKETQLKRCEDDTWYYYALMLKFEGKYSEALKVFNHYLALPAESNRNFVDEALLQRNGCLLAISQVDETPIYSIESGKNVGANSLISLDTLRDDFPFAYMGQVSYSGDSGFAVFYMDSTANMGGTDIWYCVKSQGHWQKPNNIGPLINSKGDEMNPVVSKDGNTLFFASNGHPGYGGFDIYIAEHWQNGGKIINPGSPLNTCFDESRLELDETGGMLWSNRNNPGNDSKLLRVKVKPFYTDPINKSDSIIMEALRSMMFACAVYELPEIFIKSDYYASQLLDSNLLEVTRQNLKLITSDFDSTTLLNIYNEDQLFYSMLSNEWAIQIDKINHAAKVVVDNGGHFIEVDDDFSLWYSTLSIDQKQLADRLVCMLRSHHEPEPAIKTEGTDKPADTQIVSKPSRDNQMIDALEYYVDLEDNGKHRLNRIMSIRLVNEQYVLNYDLRKRDKQMYTQLSVEEKSLVQRMIKFVRDGERYQGLPSDFAKLNQLPEEKRRMIMRVVVRHAIGVDDDNMVVFNGGDWKYYQTLNEDQLTKTKHIAKAMREHRMFFSASLDSGYVEGLDSSLFAYYGETTPDDKEESLLAEENIKNEVQPEEDETEKMVREREELLQQATGGGLYSIKRRTEPIENEKIYHVVTRGENLRKIAKMYNVEVEQLVKMNSLTSKRIKPGTKLLVGEKKPAN